MTAEPMAMPLVSALVVLPTASRSARIWRASLVVSVLAHLARGRSPSRRCRWRCRPPGRTRPC